MADHIKIRKIQGTWVLRAGGTVLGETADALEMCEGDYPPVIYFPRTDIAMAFLDRSDTTSICPHKGKASYFSIQTKSVLIKDAGWFYETPLDGKAQITGNIAFYSDKVSIEKV